MILRAVIRPSVAGCAMCIAALCGCEAGIPKSALELSPQSLEQRQMESRRFDTRDEGKILAAAAGLLQDLGYTIDSTESKLGLIVASKDRDAHDGGQVAGAVALAVLFGARTAVDRNQKIRVSVVTHPVENQIALRVTFQRVIWNTNNQISRLEFVGDPKIYQEFFDKLSKAVFLEAQQI